MRVADGFEVDGCRGVCDAGKEDDGFDVAGGAVRLGSVVDTGAGVGLVETRGRALDAVAVPLGVELDRDAG